MESLAVIITSITDYELFSIAKNFDRYIILTDISDLELERLKQKYELSVLVDKDNKRDFGYTIVIRSSGQPHVKVELDPKRSI